MTYSASTLTGQTVEELAQQTTEQLWRIQETTQQLQSDIYRLRDGALATFVAAMYGGMNLSTPPVADIIGTGWTPIDAFDSDSVTPRGFLQDFTNGLFTVLYQGVYVWQLAGTFDVAESNQGRTAYVRLYNTTQNAPASIDYTVPIARNQPAVAFALFGIVDFTDPAGIGDIGQFEISASETLSGVAWTSLDFGIYSVGEWKEAELRRT